MYYSPRDLDEWYYTTDGLRCPRYISPSKRILIMEDPIEIDEDGSTSWFWRIYNDGVPEIGGHELLSDTSWDYQFYYFENAAEAYFDMLDKGMMRSRR